MGVGILTSQIALVKGLKGTSGIHVDDRRASPCGVSDDRDTLRSMEKMCIELFFFSLGYVERMLFRSIRGAFRDLKRKGRCGNA